MSDLHIPDAINALYSHPGPFATIYLDATRATESGAHEVQLRVDALAASLRGAGADEKTVDALVDAVTTADRAPGSHGAVLVAADGEVLLDRALPNPPARALADLSPVPHLLPLLAQSAPRVAHVIVLADRTGADVVTVSADAAASGAVPPPQDVEGSHQRPIHQTGRDVWDERHHQNRVDNTWAGNAQEVASYVERQVKAVSAELVIYGGDPHAVGILKQALPEVLGQGIEIAEVENASRAAGGNEIPRSVHDAVLAHQWRARRGVLEHLQQNLGREKWAVAGVQAVVEALRQAQVDTLVISDDPSSTLRAWVGPAALDIALSREDLVATGVELPQQVRLDAALVRAVAGTNAQLLITPNGHDYLPEGIGALLRY
ncbi:MAG: baeRF2 domain-containing protein [Jatrophihabitans sp.]|uniref:baeRF2 domain-containing protein n=1 Tax=Jatrophihabitans sp. TaxID=1932789 RepID=UPI003F8066A4